MAGADALELLNLHQGALLTVGGVYQEAVEVAGSLGRRDVEPIACFFQEGRIRIQDPRQPDLFPSVSETDSQLLSLTREVGLRFASLWPRDSV